MVIETPNPLHANINIINQTIITLKNSTGKLLKYESIISVVKHYTRREINNVKNNIVPNREKHHFC